ncbi:MAG: protein-L-isoaspartate(D-aspartate) O-methyltransferase [Gemmatimonadales bacterium]
MVRRQLAARGISDRRVLAAMVSVPREIFVSPDMQHLAYADQAVRIGRNQTISQPYIVAVMTEQARIRRNSKVLEIGTGSGYHTAVVARLAQHVWSVERFEDLSILAERRLFDLGISNATLLVGDGAHGHGDDAPYNAIVVAAAAPRIPEPLMQQLAVGGRLVIPIGDRVTQTLHVIERTGDGYLEAMADSCRFVPLISPEAFAE